ncbi:hypothetical protein [Sphingomonas sp.]|uniref:hypothetical protein n=1 Tax=Sphingomonas sp. TaxID=28214 RepID=UPI002BD59B2F|nr:hypothetical protein [Sphingomonas sp.]HTG38553.1 hypothetical protein [Sphingomonas sp.]
MTDLDDPEYARFAWTRFRRILGWMTVLALACAIGALVILYHWVGHMPIHMGIATFLGMFGTVMMGGALMGLVFLSSGSGHDDSVDRVNRAHDPGRQRHDDGRA